jgi:hypothetical protein
MGAMGKHSVYDVSIETNVSPERLLAAATAFTDRRPDLWPNIDRKQYRVFSVGDHTAEWKRMRLSGGGAETYRRWFMKTIAVVEMENPAATS